MSYFSLFVLKGIYGYWTWGVFANGSGFFQPKLGGGLVALLAHSGSLHTQRSAILLRGTTHDLLTPEWKLCRRRSTFPGVLWTIFLLKGQGPERQVPAVKRVGGHARLPTGARPLPTDAHQARMHGRTLQSHPCHFAKCRLWPTPQPCLHLSQEAKHQSAAVA